MTTWQPPEKDTVWQPPAGDTEQLAPAVQATASYPPQAQEVTAAATPASQLPEVPPIVRAMVGMSTRPEHRLATLRQFFPQAQVTPLDEKGSNYEINDPKQGRLQYNTPFEGASFGTHMTPAAIGDVASIGPEAAQMAGGTAGALIGAPAGPVGSAAGSGIGAAAGEELYRQAVGPLLEQQTGVTLPQRTPGQMATDVGTTALLNAAGQFGGELTGLGMKWAGKYFFRGGAEGGRQFAQAVTDANKWGVPISVGQAADNAWSLFDSMATGAAKAFKKNTEVAVGNQLVQMAKQTAPGKLISYEGVGRAVTQGIDTYGKAFRATGKALDQQFFNLVPKDTAIPVNNTLAAIQRVLPDMPSMPATAGAEMRAPLGQRMQRLLQDIQDGNGSLQLNDVRTFRRQIGEMIDTGGLVEDIPVIKLRDLNAGLSADLADAADAAGPAARAAFQKSQAYWAKELQTMENVVNPIVAKNVPSDVARALEGKMKNGPEYVREVMKRISPEQRDVIRAATIRKLGVDKKTGSWSFDKFLGDWNGLDQSVRNTLFKDRGYLTDLNALAKTAERISAAKPAEQGVLPKYALAGALGGVTGAGGWMVLPIGFVLTSMGAAGGQRVMRNRAFVSWLAKAVTTSPAGIGAHIGRLGAIAKNTDPQTAEDIHTFLDGLSSMGSSSGNGQ